MIKALVISAIFLGPLSSQAATTYRCENVQSMNGYSDTTLTLSKRMLSSSLKSVTLVNTIRAYEIKADENPFTSYYARSYQVDPDAVAAASKLNFKRISENSRSYISLSESLLNEGASGYAHYYSKSCLILECNIYSYYFHCVRNY